MNRYTRALPLGLALALTAMGALAQNTAPATTSGAAPAATVGTTPQEASTAMKEAVPRSDTATVVRTAPSAADKAQAVVDNTTGSTAGTSTAMGSGAATTPSTTSNRPAVMRTARADRN